MDYLNLKNELCCSCNCHSQNNVINELTNLDLLEFSLDFFIHKFANWFQYICITNNEKERKIAIEIMGQKLKMYQAIQLYLCDSQKLTFEEFCIKFNEDFFNINITEVKKYFKINSNEKWNISLFAILIFYARNTNVIIEIIQNYIKIEINDAKYAKLFLTNYLIKNKQFFNIKYVENYMLITNL